MPKKRDKKQVSEDTDSTDAENLPPKEQALSRLRAAYRINKTRKRHRKSESEEADSSDNDNDKTPSTDPISDDARTPPQKKVVKTRKPKRSKKSSVPDRKIKQEIVSEQEAKKLSPVRRHQSSRSGKTP